MTHLDNICDRRRRRYLDEQRQADEIARNQLEMRMSSAFIAQLAKEDEECHRRMKPIHAAESAEKEEQRKAKYELHQAREARRQKK